ncbi:MAG: undecaprenyldiphospho-muramoylpentapeptide beta-N-acetylglucosaminyltransferase [Bdellovibrionaceae bacterium]|nr:undecaprenyldiphospho-muramoylpentapeptide beta-N-acetylglucosaminyltransferase [Pseudobdellovibrionaceae bacterium]
MATSKETRKTIVITGGGTGGHIYPGLAIAQTLEELDKNLNIVFVGAKGGMEEKIFPRYKYPYYLIKIGRLHSSVGRIQQIKTLLGMPFALIHAFQIYWSLKPSAVLGVGGFASGPFVFIAALMGSKTYLWEANAYPGLTNRWLSRFVRATFIVFEQAKQLLPSRQIIFSGMPVRQEFFSAAPDITASTKMRVLVFGGSQGARFLNETVVAMITKHPELLDEIDLVHQTGNRDYAIIVQKYGTLANKAQVREYIHNMPEELKKTDFVICRSGASTVAEVISCRKPALFVPLPTAADNHQFHNAQVVAEKGGALVIEQKNLDPEKLLKEIRSLQKNRAELQSMSNKLDDFRFENASRTVAQAILEGV